MGGRHGTRGWWTGEVGGMAAFIRIELKDTVVVIGRGWVVHAGGEQKNQKDRKAKARRGRDGTRAARQASKPVISKSRKSF